MAGQGDVIELLLPTALPAAGAGRGVRAILQAQILLNAKAKPKPSPNPLSPSPPLAGPWAVTRGSLLANSHSAAIDHGWQERYVPIGEKFRRSWDDEAPATFC